MGRTTERWRSYVSQAKSGAAGRKAEEQTLQSEQQRRFGEMFLGSEEQLSDASSYDPSIIPYTQRYTYDAETIAALGGSQWGPDGIMHRGLNERPGLAAEWAAYSGAQHASERSDEDTFGGTPQEFFKEVYGYENAVLPGGGGMSAYAQFAADRVNHQLDLAQEAAEAGDFEKADALKQKAEDMLNASSPARTGPETANFVGAFYMKDDADYIAKAQLSGPMAHTTGQIVKEGREILDRSSETSQAFRDSITRGANLKLAAGMRGTQRTIRQMGAAGGGAYNPAQAAAQGASLMREMSAQLAQVEASAGLAYEQYRTQAAMSSVDFGLSFLDRQAGVRDEFNQMNNQLLMHQSEMMMQAAQLSMQFSQLSQQQAQASQSRSDAFIGMGIGAVSSIIGAAITKKAGSGSK